MNAGQTLRKAALAGDLDGMSSLLDSEPDLAVSENPEDLPLDRLALTVQFHMAILDGSIDRVRELLVQQGDLVGQRWTPQQFTPLSQAVVQCDHEAFDLFIQHGAEPLETYDEGSSLLHTAAYSGCVSLARHLLEMGLEVNRKSDRGEMPLKIAKDSKQQVMVDFLVSQGAIE